MKPGTKPKPTHLKLVKGNPGKRSLNRKEAKAKAVIPAPPHHLTAAALEESNRVATELYNLGVLSEIDRAALAAYAMAYGSWVQAERAIAKMTEKLTASSEPRRTPATASPAAVARAESKGGPYSRKVPQDGPTTRPVPRPPEPGSPAGDDPPQSDPQAGCKKTNPTTDLPNRASSPPPTSGVNQSKCPTSRVFSSLPGQKHSVPA